MCFNRYKDYVKTKAAMDGMDFDPIVAMHAYEADIGARDTKQAAMDCADLCQRKAAEMRARMARDSKPKLAYDVAPHWLRGAPRRKGLPLDTRNAYKEFGEQRVKIAYHEAGHGIVARVLGAPDSYLSISRIDDMLGGSTHTKVPETTALGVDQKVMIGLAGHIAEQLANFQTDFKHEEQYDTDKSLILKAAMDAKLSQDTFNQTFKRCYNLTRKILTEHWHQVDAIATRLVDTGKLSAKQIDVILGG